MFSASLWRGREGRTRPQTVSPPRGPPAVRAAQRAEGRATRGRTPPGGGASPRAAAGRCVALCGAGGRRRRNRVDYRNSFCCDVYRFMLVFPFYSIIGNCVGNCLYLILCYAAAIAVVCTSSCVVCCLCCCCPCFFICGRLCFPFCVLCCHCFCLYCAWSCTAVAMLGCAAVRKGGDMSPKPKKRVLPTNPKTGHPVAG